MRRQLVDDPLLAGDVHTLLSLSRPLHLRAPSVSSGSNDINGIADEFAFVPPLVMATLVSFLPDAAQLRRLLRQDWTTSWNGWQFASSILDTCYSDEVSQEVVQM